MKIIGILITIIAVLMVIYPNFFIKYHIPKLPEKISSSPKMKIFVRLWGCICSIIGIILIIFLSA